MRQALMDRINNRLERFLPEQRLFLKSYDGTRFVRLSPTTQLLAFGGTGLFVAWTVVVTAFFLLGTISAGSARDQTARAQTVYEGRLNALSHERDARALEADQAVRRFYVALEQVSQMQSELLRSEERLGELGTGIEVIQAKLRTAITERDEARTRADVLLAELQTATGSTQTTAGRLEDVETTLSFLTDALDNTALQRDEAIEVAISAESETRALETTIDAITDRNEQIFARLEDAVEVSLEPLEKIFAAAGMPTDRILEQVRRGYNGQGGPLAPITLSSRGNAAIDAETARANDLLRRMEEVDVYRIAAERSPLDHPVRGSYRTTSGFGPRWGRMHNGLDFAGPHGTDIVATADGVVTHAGWSGGYGKLIKIKHEFGFETRYAHLTTIRVQVGQRVSRGAHIGDMGSTGRSTGTHLHYEVRSGGRALNPQPFVRAGQNVF